MKFQFKQIIQRPKYRLTALESRFPSPVLCAWTAGILDGEGSISVGKFLNKRRPDSYYLRVSVGNTDFKMMELLLKTWGGRIYKMNRMQAVTQLQQYTWSMNSNHACRFLKAILPYLVTKKERAQIGIEFQEGMSLCNIPGRNFVTKEELERREEIFMKMRRLNAGWRMRKYDENLKLIK